MHLRDKLSYFQVRTLVLASRLLSAWDASMQQTSVAWHLGCHLPLGVMGLMGQYL